MGQYGLVWVAGLVHALSDAFDVAGEMEVIGSSITPT